MRKICFFILFFVINDCFAQDNQTFQFLKLADLPFIDNYKTIEDNQGFIWICSENGVVKYNFDQTKKFTTKEGLPTNDIWDLFPDKQNRVWLLYRGKGLRYIRNDKIYSIPKAKQLNELFVIGEKNDTVFFRCFDINYKSNNRTYYLTKNNQFGLLHSKKNSTLQFENKIDGYQIYLNESGQYFSISKFGKIKLVYTPYSIGTVFVKNDQFVYLKKANDFDSLIFFRNGDFSAVSSVDYFGTKINRIYINSNSKSALVETKKGIRYYENIISKKRNFDIERILSYYYKKFGMSFHVLEDSQKNIWITIHRGGVYFIPRNYRKISSYNLSQSNRNLESNFSYIENIENILIIVNRDHQVFKYSFEEKKFIKLFEHKHLRQLDHKKNIFIAHSELGETFIFNLQTNRLLSLPLSIKAYSFDFISDQEILFSSGQVFSLKTNKLSKKRFYFGDKKIIKVRIVGDKIFCLNLDGIKVFSLKSGKKVKSHSTNNPLQIKTIDQTIWVSLDGNGILVFNKNGDKIDHLFKKMSIKDFISYGDKILLTNGEKVFAFIKKDNGYKLQNTFNSNLSKLQKQIQAITIFGDDLFCATNEGVISIPIESVLAKENVKIHSYLVATRSNNHILPLKNKYILPFSDNNLEFDFQSSSYNSIIRPHFIFKLKGEENWIRNSSNGIIELRNLSPGEYVLTCTANNGKELSKSTSIKILISPPFWMSWWFITLVIIFFLFICYLIIIKIISLRSTFLTRKNKLLELELKAVKSQLNPHFIFNAMNTLQSFIYTKSEIELNAYLVSFSQLIRAVLDNSKTDFVLLKDEIQFLKDYINIMSVKLEDGVDVQWDIDPKLNTYEFSIRNMLIQPFVENALIHGLTNKVGSKKLNLKFCIEDSMLRVEVTDNGIGRNGSQELQKKNNYKHRSWASTILKEKTEIINLLYQEDLKYQIEDLENGTKVILQIRLFKLQDKAS